KQSSSPRKGHRERRPEPPRFGEEKKNSEKSARGPAGKRRAARRCGEQSQFVVGSTRPTAMRGRQELTRAAVGFSQAPPAGGVRRTHCRRRTVNECGGKV